VKYKLNRNKTNDCHSKPTLGFRCFLRQHDKKVIHSLFIVFFFLISNAVSAQKAKEILPETEPQKTQRFVLESLLADGMRFVTMEEYSRADSVLRKALTLSPNLAAVNYELAKILVKQDKSDEAAIFAQKAYDIAPQNKYYLVQLAEVYTQQRKYDKAADLYKELIDRSPDNAEYGFELASVYLLDDRYEDAIKAYNGIEKTTGINESIVHQKQRIYIRLNKIDKAIAEAEKLIKNDPTESQYVVELAQLYLMTGKTAEATAQLEQALVVNPDEADAQLMLSEIYKKNGNAKAADQQMGVMFNNPNADIDVKMQALNAMMRQAKDPAAKQEVMSRAQEIVKAHPKDALAYTVYADLLMQNGQKVEARNQYVKAVKIEKSVSQVWGAILQLDSELNQTDSLITHSEQALELFPNNGLFWYSNGTGYLLKRNYGKAAESLEESLRWSSKNPELTNAIHSQLGDAYNGTGEHEKSDEAYEAALKGNPNNDHVMNNYSYFLSLRKQKLERAKELSAKVVERNPDNATFLDTYAWVLYVMKDYQQAKQYLEKAVNNKAVSSTITEHYGDVLFKLGEKEKALEQWKKAKSTGKNDPQLNKKIETGLIVE
jgi:tetratricopeptide (TPR) repeat protein